MRARCRHFIGVLLFTMPMCIVAEPAVPMFQLHLLSGYDQPLVIECRLQHAAAKVHAIHFDIPGFSARIVPQKEGTLVIIRSARPIKQDLIRMHPTVETSEGTVSETWVIHFDTQSIERITEIGTPKHSLQAGVQAIAHHVPNLATDATFEAAEEKMYEHAILDEEHPPVSPQAPVLLTTNPASCARCHHLQERVEKLEQRLDQLQQKLQQLQRWHNE